MFWVLTSKKIIIYFLQFVSISQHEYVIAIQLLGLSKDRLINNNVLLQDIGLHINLQHP